MNADGDSFKLVNKKASNTPQAPQRQRTQNWSDPHWGKPSQT